LVNRTTSFTLLLILFASLAFSSLLTSEMAHAQDDSRNTSPMEQLLTARVPVSSQTTGERNRALKDGFAEVLIRVSGHSDVLQRSAIRSELSRANDYVIQYGYTSEQEQTLLQVSFNEERVIQLLRDTGVSVWSARRPEIMVWIAAQDNSGSRAAIELIARDTGHDIVDALATQAKIRGLSLSFPLLDLTDRLAISASDVWGRFEQPVVTATQRYSANGMVMVRLTENDGVPVAEWSLVLGSLRTSGVVQQTNFADLGAALANDLVEQVASEYAVSFSGSEQQEVTLRLLNARQLEQVIAAEELLSHLSPVVRVTMTRYHQGTAEFSLLIVGDKARVAQSLELERRLQRIEDPWSRSIGGLLEYRWLR